MDMFICHRCGERKNTVGNRYSNLFSPPDLDSIDRSCDVERFLCRLSPEGTRVVKICNILVGRGKTFRGPVSDLECNEKSLKQS
jgi:hypothetical protein